MPATTKALHESHEDYPYVLLIEGDHRVILCQDRIQFILQRSRMNRGHTEWRSIAFCVTRKALERGWARQSGTLVPVELAGLPEVARKVRL